MTPPRQDPRNTIILAQTILVVVLLGFLLSDHLPPISRTAPGGAAGEAVSVLDVVLDREQLRFLDIVFDRPLGAGLSGDVLGRDPVVLTPSAGGTWRWQSDNVLRLQPSDRLIPATEYRFELLADRLLKPGQVFAGKTSFSVRTDQFQVERVDLYEEQGPPETGGVVVRGDARFNYPVDPKVLAARMRLIDPARGASSPLRLDLETYYPSRIISFRSEPIQKQKAERELTLSILSDLTPAQGNVPLAADYAQKIALGSNEVLTIRSVEATSGDPDSTLKVTFSSPIAAEAAERFIAISPEARHRAWSERNVLVLAGALAPGGEYELTVNKGLSGTDGSLLKETWIRKVRMPDIDPHFDFQSEGMFLSSSGYHNVAISSVNVAQVQLEIDRVFRNNLFMLFEYYGYAVGNSGSFGFPSRSLGTTLAKETLRLEGGRNRRVVTPLNLDRWVKGHEPGLYRIGLGQLGSYEGTQRWLLVTDLGIVAKVGAGDCTVWVASFADLSPVAGAQVRLISDQNQTLAQGRTDDSGKWRARDLPDEGEDRPRPFMVTVERDGDFSFLLLDRSGIDTAGFDVGGAQRPKGGYEAFLYGERDLYRPGEKVRGLVVVRDRGLRAPPSMPLLLRHKDPEGQERGTVRLTIDSRGLAAFEREIPTYARTGRHTLEALVAEQTIGQYRFLVEEFIPDRIKVEIAPKTPDVGPGATLSYDVAGTYLFGPPAANLPVESRVRLVAAPFESKRHPEFTFGDPLRAFEPREIVVFEGQKLDAAGRRAFDAPVPAGLRPPASLEAILTARVQEEGGRGVSAMQRLRVHPYPLYLGLRRMGEAYPEPGRAVEFRWIALTPQAEETKAPALRASFYRDRWQTVLRRTPEGNFRYESVRETDLVETKAVPPGGSSGTLGFTPREYGTYRLAIEDPTSGASTQLEFYASGWGYSPWAMKDPGRLELDLDKTEYEPGDTAILQVRAPFPGKLFVAVERDAVQDTQIHVLTGNTAKIAIRVAADYRPNVYVSAVLVRPVKDLEPGAAGRAFGAVPLVVNRSARRLPVTVTAPDEIRPGTKLDVHVTAQPGAAVTVAAVDEGILQLVAQKTPDPFGWFYRKLRLGVRTYDIFAQLLPEVPAAIRPPAGGDEAMQGLAQFVRTDGIRRVKPVAFWTGVLQTGPDGEASAGFEVPDFQGALRLMAVAVRDDRFGSTERMTRVRSPLVLLPTLPRILSFGETARIPVTVRNDTGRAGSFEVRFDARGAARVQGPPAQTVTIPGAAEKTLFFGVTTREPSGEAGEAQFTIGAEGNGEAASTATQIPVRPDLPAISLETAGSVDQDEMTIGGADWSRLRPGSVRRELHIGPLPLVRFSSRLRDLLHYPYGCAEQTISTVFPLIYFGDIAREWDPETFRTSDPAALVQAGIRRLGSMQIYSGGFAMWPGSEELAPWASVYATHFLVEARRAGHLVEPWLYDRALQFTSGEARTKTAYGPGELQRAVYALFVLSRAGKPDAGSMDFLRERHTRDLKSEGRALLGAAYAAAGDLNRASDLLADVDEAPTPIRETGGNFNSPMRNRALLLLALLDAQPSDPRLPQIAQRLSRDAESQGWWSTQETAWVFLALGRLHRRQTEKAAWTGAVFVGDRRLGTISAKSHIFRDIEGAEPIRVQMDAGYEKGAAFYALRTRGIPTDASFHPEQAGLELQRTLLDRSGAPLDAAPIAQGDLIVVKTRVRSRSGRIDNVVVQNLLPSGLEVENPRLKSSEMLPWMLDAGLDPEFLDLRDDRVLLFTDLESDQWLTFYALLRAVTPGTFRLPPVQAEAMYDGSLRATGERGTIVIEERR